MGKVSAASLSAPCRAGEGRGESAGLCALLCPTLRRVLQIPAPSGIIRQGNPAFKSGGVVPACFSEHFLPGLQALKNFALSGETLACLRTGNNAPWHNLFCSGDEIGLLNDKKRL